MTENSFLTITRKDDPREKVFETDGRALSGSEVRIVDDREQPVPADMVGHLQTRGITHFVGYLKRPELNPANKDGWFDTGDLALMDRDGYIRIAGRSKDIIIRGGENVPVAEVAAAGHGIRFAHGLHEVRGAGALAAAHDVAAGRARALAGAQVTAEVDVELRRRVRLTDHDGGRLRRRRSMSERQRGRVRVRQSAKLPVVSITGECR